MPVVVPARTAVTACAASWIREPVGDVDTELAGGHELHRTPQVASDERRVRPTEGPEVEAGDADAPQPQRRGTHLLVLCLGGVTQRKEPS